MNANRSKNLGPAGQWMIFAGAPSVAMALVTCAQDSLVRAVGQGAFPYVVVAIVGASFVFSMAVYRRVPPRRVIPIGIVGWMLTFSLLFWYFWFGPGSLR